VQIYKNKCRNENKVLIIIILVILYSIIKKYNPMHKYKIVNEFIQII